jgi:Protein of unknown function (DUF2892)
MFTNVGTIDRVIRIVAGAALIGLALLAPDLRFSYLGWLGVIPIITAFVGYCPLYSILGIRTDSGEAGKR